MSSKAVVEIFYDVVYRKPWDIDLKLRPFALGGVMKATGNKPPGLVPAKGQYMLSDIARLSAYYGVPLSPPSDMPEVMFKKGTLKAQRLLTAVSERTPDHLEALSHALWTRIWSKDLDITENDSLRAACLDAKIDASLIDQLLTDMVSDGIKAKLTETTNDAINRGAFGAPTFFVNGEMYFGCDRFNLMARQLNKRWVGPFPEAPTESDGSKL